MKTKSESTPRNFSPETRTQLCQAGHYREFLQIYFRATELPYAEVARRGGFSSRSYPRDVTEGRRRLTAKSLPSLVRGLRLEPGLSRLLRSLYFSAYPDEHPEDLAPQLIRARLEKERERARRGRKSVLRQRGILPELKELAERDFPRLAAGLTDVVAALGEIKGGATLEEIQRRTGFGKPGLAQKLATLVKEGVIAYAGDSRRYFPATEHLDWTGQAGSRLAKSVFQSSVERLGHAAQSHFAHGDAMFMNSALSIPKEKLPRLKEELREVILRFVDRSVEASGAPDTVAQLVVGLFEGRLAPPREP